MMETRKRMAPMGMAPMGSLQNAICSPQVERRRAPQRTPQSKKRSHLPHRVEMRKRKCRAQSGRGKQRKENEI
jgi:hypothetical protein